MSGAESIDWASLRCAYGSAERILEYWITAEDPDEFNRHIVGLIEVVREFR